MLMPFKASFYETLGYAIANSTHEINIPVASLDNYLKVNYLSALTCDRLPATEVKDIVSNFLYENLRSPNLQPHSHGLIITNFSYEQWWHLHRQKLCVVVKRGNQPVGLAIYAIDSSGNLAVRDRQIDISSIFWTDLESRDRLFHFFATHRDQIHSLKMPIPISTNVHTWLHDAGKLESVMSDPWMVRAVDVVNALQGLPISCPPFTFALHDRDCHWNEGIFSVNGDRGSLSVKRCSGDLSKLAIDFSATIAGISALIYGTHPIAELVHRQWITKISDRTYQILEAAFTPCLIYNPFRF
jgi:predicted acetyltransferase